MVVPLAAFARPQLGVADEAMALPARAVHKRLQSAMEPPSWANFLPEALRHKPAAAACADLEGHSHIETGASDVAKLQSGHQLLPAIPVGEMPLGGEATRNSNFAGNHADWMVLNAAGGNAHTAPSLVQSNLWEPLGSAAQARLSHTGQPGGSNSGVGMSTAPGGWDAPSYGPQVPIAWTAQGPMPLQSVQPPQQQQLPQEQAQQQQRQALQQPQQQQPLSSQQSQAMSQQVTAAQQAMSQQAQQAQMQQFMQLHQWYGQSGATQVQGSLAMSSPMQCPPAHGTGKYGFSMQSGGSGVANMYEQDFNAATPQTGASATTPCLQSCQRGYWVGEIMRLWKLPPDLDQGGLNSAYEQLQYSLEFLYAQGLTPTLSNIQQHMTEMGVKRLIKDNIMQIAAYRREVFTLWIPANFKACILLTERLFADATLPDYSPFLVESMISEQELAFRKSLTDFLPQMVSHYYSMHNNVSDFRFDAAASSASHESPSAARASEAEEVCPRCLRYRQNCVCVVVAVPPPPAPEAVPGQLRVALSQELAKPDSAKVGTPPVMDVEEGQDPDLFEGNPAVFNNKECTNAAKRLAAIIDAKQSTTLMIRNIPKNVKQKRLLKEVDGSGFADLYDFCYLPSSFGKGYEAQGMGYAFVNFEKVSSGMEFALAWHGSRRFNMIKSDTPLTISCAEFQGKEANASRWSRKGCRVRNPDLRPFIKGPCDILEGDVRAEDKETEKNDKEDAAGSMNVQVLPAGQCGSGFCGMPPPGLPIPQFAQVGPLPSALQPPPGLAAPDVAETFAAQAASIQALNLASRLAAAKPQAVQACVDYLSN
mmetsp:Transcript_13655/g.23836  ORF Transcript_13655/g.23836 Transcript_13655/m.23836 type:complete len:819 (-) Transcript_13655:137-2593(-)